MAVERRFRHYPKRPAKLTPAFVKRRYLALLDAVAAAEKAPRPDAWISLFSDWNELKSYVGSEAARLGHAHNQNTRDKKAEADYDYFREKVAPVVEAPEHQLTAALLNSRHRQAVGRRFGPRLLTVYDISLKGLDPVNTKLRIKARRLTKKYENLIANATIKVRGETITLWKARSLMESPDRQLRKEVFLARGDWILRNRQTMAGIYGQLVKLRQQMARNVGYRDYLPYIYQNLGRTDYGQKDVERFRQAVREHLVPLNKQLASRQAKALGLKKLRPWDAGFDPETTLPLGITPVNRQLGQAAKLFHKLSPVLGRHFDAMRRYGLIDLANRPNKRSGAYCTDFTDEAKVAILCNSTGDADDISTLTHEMGHVFQMLESMDIEAVDLVWGSYDLAEVYSTGMEFLSLPHLGLFMEPQHAKKFAIGRWRQSVSMICYICVVDEFQHWVYKNPRATARQRDQAWTKISRRYLPEADYGGYQKYLSNRWYFQQHIFSSPLYYIDYALAETCAIQLAKIDEQDHQKAMAIYLKLCKMGGTKSFVETVEAGGLRSPFEAGLLAELAGFLEQKSA